MTEGAKVDEACAHCGLPVHHSCPWRTSRNGMPLHEECARVVMFGAHEDVAPSVQRRKELLKAVEDCVCKDRQASYGAPEENFEHIAKVASIVLGKEMTALDVAKFLACVKLVRLRTSPEHLDNWIDLAGYAVCGGSLVKGNR